MSVSLSVTVTVTEREGQPQAEIQCLGMYRYAVNCNSTVPQEQRAGYIALGERNEAQAQAAAAPHEVVIRTHFIVVVVVSQRTPKMELRLNLYEEKVFRTLQNFRVACGHFGGCVAHVTRKLCELFLVNLLYNANSAKLCTFFTQKSRSTRTTATP